MLTREHAMSVEQGYRTILTLDFERVGRPDQDDQILVRLRGGLRDALAQALANAEISKKALKASSPGSGLLVLVDPMVTTAKVVRAVLDQLPAALAEHNRLSAEAVQLRARAVIHAAHVLLDDQGPASREVDLAFRLLDSAPLRERLRQATGPLVVGVSDDIYRQVVRNRHLGLDPSAFQAVEITVDRIHARMWISPTTAEPGPSMDARGVLPVAGAEAPPSDLSGSYATLADGLPKRDHAEALPEHIPPDQREQLLEDAHGALAVALEEAHRMGDVIPILKMLDQTDDVEERRNLTQAVRAYRTRYVEGIALLVEEYRQCLAAVDPDDWRSEVDYTVGMLGVKGLLQEVTHRVAKLRDWPTGNEGHEQKLQALWQILEMSQRHIDTGGPNEYSRGLAVETLRYLGNKLGLAAEALTNSTR
jgi:hypothetical protein